MLLANAPDVVNINKPLVLISRRPIDSQREPRKRGSRVNTVSRPCGSSRVTISPSGL